MIRQMRRILLDIKEQGTIIIFASHNMVDIYMMCDMVRLMEYGKLYQGQFLLL